MPVNPAWHRWLITVLLLALVALSWSGRADELAHQNTTLLFKKALAAAAVARTMNGVISVAQGTEVAIQPVGVGVTLTLGEILDPLNDLVERFSLLALAASVSLGIQITLGEMVSHTWISALLTLSTLLYVTLLWGLQQRGETAGRWLAGVAQFVIAVIFVRFLLAAVLLVCHVLDATFLAKPQDLALAELSSTSTAIEALQQESTHAQAEEEAGFLDRTGTHLKQFLDSSSQSLDLKAQLTNVREKIESSIEDMIRLITIFILQTMLLPLAGAWVYWQLLKKFWLWNRAKF